MRKRTPAELEKARITKVTRTLIRLKHSLAADVELNKVLPDTLADFDEALSRGELKELKADLAIVLGTE